MHALMDTLQQSINDFADGFHEEGQLHGVWELEKNGEGGRLCTCVDGQFRLDAIAF
ncbi:hypothetical protein [Vibrio parahaemolyticus]|uniref:hypothetical protein n=1 Tax=Vibrio parahaemolyticus TaxID=670 RepID=UPI001C5A1694|nr:hypothetical protein [Vibrio parahaemolyticus]